MTVEIPPQYRQFVEGMIGSGAFQTESQVVGEALRLFQDCQRRLAEVRQAVRPALERLERGEGIELDDESLDEFFEDIKARGRKRKEERQEAE